MKDSFLSERIYRLLHENAYLPLHNQNIEATFLPFFESIQDKLDLNVCDDSYDYYSRMVTDIRSHVFHCHALLQRLSVDEFFTAYFPFIKWSPCSSLILHNFKKWKDEIPQSEWNCFRTLLHLGYLIERSLGGVFMAKSQLKCPNMLKDILNSAEIRTVLGDGLVAYIKVFVGPVTSLNLRNLAWHGFLRPCDLHPAYISVLFFLFVDIGRVLDRTDLSGSKLSSIVPNFNSAALTDLAFFDPSPDSLLRLSHLLTARQDSVSVAFLPFFDSAFSVLRDHPDPLAQLDVLCSLLPLLEHTARCIYVRSNALSTSLLHASDGTFFCTFDDILSPFCSSGAQNQLPDAVDTGVVTFLCDLLAYPAGPRLRDHISHGEIPPEDSYFSAICAILSAFECLLNPIPPSWAATYRSQFHPVELCRAQLMLTSNSSSLLSFASRIALRAPARSLFRSADLEPLFLLLRQISAVVDGLSTSTGEFRRQRKAEMMARKLRSRQRENFARFEVCEPEIRRIIRLCLTVAIVCFVRVACQERRVEDKEAADMRRLLVLCEKSQSLVDRAKWRELNEFLTGKTLNFGWLFDSV